MRRRPSSRLLVVDPGGRVLLFRFSHRSGALAGQSFWATPGGGLENGESFEEGAVRELREETGIAVDAVGSAVADRLFEMTMPDGERVLAEERFYLVRSKDAVLSKEGWTAEEHDVMAEHAWWFIRELEEATETVYPEDLAEMLRRVGLT